MVSAMTMTVNTTVVTMLMISHQRLQRGDNTEIKMIMIYISAMKISILES